jgi:ribonuclease HI
MNSSEDYLEFKYGVSTYVDDLALIFPSQEALETGTKILCDINEYFGLRANPQKSKLLSFPNNNRQIELNMNGTIVKEAPNNQPVRLLRIWFNSQSGLKANIKIAVDKTIAILKLLRKRPPSPQRLIYMIRAVLFPAISYMLRYTPPQSQVFLMINGKVRKLFRQIMQLPQYYPSSLLHTTFLSNVPLLEAHVLRDSIAEILVALNSKHELAIAVMANVLRLQHELWVYDDPLAYPPNIDPRKFKNNLAPLKPLMRQYNLAIVNPSEDQHRHQSITRDRINSEHPLLVPPSALQLSADARNELRIQGKTHPADSENPWTLASTMILKPHIRDPAAHPVPAMDGHRGKYYNIYLLSGQFFVANRAYEINSKGICLLIHRHVREDGLHPCTDDGCPWRSTSPNSMYCGLRMYVDRLPLAVAQTSSLLNSRAPLYIGRRGKHATPEQVSLLLAMQSHYESRSERSAPTQDTAQAGLQLTIGNLGTWQGLEPEYWQPLLTSDARRSYPSTTPLEWLKRAHPLVHCPPSRIDIFAYSDGSLINRDTDQVSLTAATIIYDPFREEIASTAMRLPPGPASSYRAELWGIILAIGACPPHSHLTVHLDNQSAVHAADKKLSNFNIRKRIRANCNIEWHIIRTLTDEKNIAITFRWIRGHNGHPMNEAADKMANAAHNMAEAIISLQIDNHCLLADGRPLDHDFSPFLYKLPHVQSEILAANLLRKLHPNAVIAPDLLRRYYRLPKNRRHILGQQRKYRQLAAVTATFTHEADPDKIAMLTDEELNQLESTNTCPFCNRVISPAIHEASRHINYCSLPLLTGFDPPVAVQKAIMNYYRINNTDFTSFLAGLHFPVAISTFASFSTNRHSRKRYHILSDCVQHIFQQYAARSHPILDSHNRRPRPQISTSKRRTICSICLRDDCHCAPLNNFASCGLATAHMMGSLLGRHPSDSHVSCLLPMERGHSIPI